MAIDRTKNLVFKLETVDLDAPGKDHVRVLVAQPHWQPDDWVERELLYSLRDEVKPRLWLEAFLQKATQTHCDLVLLPELSVPESLVRVITAWSKQTGTMVIGGSHYYGTDDGYVGRTPIAYKGQVHFVEKIYQAPAEVAPVQGKGLRPGKHLLVFKNSPVGTLGVLLCSDYLKDSVKRAVLDRDIDVLCIPAFQNDSRRYHKRIDIDVDNQSGGIYVLYANNLLRKHGDGASAAFGISDNLFRDKLISQCHTDKTYDSMLCKLRDEEDFFVVELDLRHKRPSQRRTVDARPNLTICERGSCGEARHAGLIRPDVPLAPSSARGSATASKQHPHQELRNAIVEKVRRLVAKHGLDDSEWTKAFSSMYFLVWLGRLLDLHDQEDYGNLLNHFLRFFNFHVNDTLYLRDDQILVTPNENERIRKCMEEEDAHDQYFALSAKTRASSVNAQLMHENYLYGVALGISAQENTRIMNAVRDTAISHLVYRANPSTRDAHGGWSPYRVPWITARILTSFSNVDLDQRVDKEHISSLIDQGLGSLIDRLQPEGYWRSGVGNWVSKWECTALCLEAFLTADKSRHFGSVIKVALAQIFTKKPVWIEPPRFGSEELSNETLAATLMSSVVLRLINASPNYLEHIPLGTEVTLYKHLGNVLDSVSGNLKQAQRQFCTIPQIAAYCAAAALGGDCVVR